MIKFQCECGRKIAAPDQWLGKRVKCPQCGKPVLVQQSVAVASALQPQPMAVPPQVMEPEHSSESDASPDSGFGRNEHTDQNERSEHDEHVEHSEHSEQNQDGEHGEEREPQDAPPMISPFSNARNGGDYSGPATTPETHFFVPPASSSSQGLPKPNVVPTLDPQHYYDDEASWGRWPRNFGIMSLLVGAVAAGLYFIPATSSAGTFVAGAGALLAIIGIVLSLRQDRAAFPWPAIALFVSIVAGGLPWLMPLIIGDQTPPAAINSNRRPPKEDPSEADKEARRRMFISVDSMLLVNDRNGLATVLVWYAAQFAVVTHWFGAVVALAWLVVIFLAARIDFLFDDRLRRARQRARTYLALRRDPSLQTRVRVEIDAVLALALALEAALLDGAGARRATHAPAT